MVSFSTRSFDFETLCKTVEQKLCDIGHLEPFQFPMTQREVIRGGKAVGIYFCVHGPRSVKLTAICDFVKNSIIYYGSDGIRAKRESVLMRNVLTAAAA